MPASDERPSDSNPAKPRWKNLIGFCVGTTLLAAAAWVVWHDRDKLSEAAAHARIASWWRIALLMSLPWASWTLTSVMYWVLMNRNDRRGTRQHVRLGEMHAVLASAWLLNYLPARPGMFGRLAYHKAVNDIPLRESVRSSIVAIACGVAGVLLLVGVTLAARALHADTTTTLVVLASPSLCACVAAAALRSREAASRTTWALALRYADVLGWMARYLVLFDVVGRPLSLLEAAAFTAVSQAASMVPLVGNGLGVREWANGLLAPSLPVGIARGLALSVELLHRAAEVTAALPVGLVGGFLVAKRMHTAK